MPTSSISYRLHSQFRTLILKIFQPKQFAVLEACIIGLICGLSGYLLKFGVGWLGSWRIALSLTIPQIFILPFFGLMGGLLTGFLVEKFAPETSGSGIPQVKAALSGIGNTLNLRVGISKLISTTLAVGSGLTLGRQGPTVQIGAAFAAWVSHWIPTSPDYRRQLIASGAAAGLAAGFNAPIAGVLFVVEELLHDVSGLTLGPAIIASFIGAVVSHHLGGELLNLTNLTHHNTAFLSQEIPFYLLLGILAGLLGVLFCRGILTILKFYKNQFPISFSFRIGLAGMSTGLVIALLPQTFHNNTGLREFLVTKDAGYQVTLIAFIAHFFLTILAAGSGAPGGLFAPSLILGSALGNLIGNFEWFHLTLPTTYSLTGMGAFFCAVSRTPITAVVIVFEITKDFELVLPLMICSIVAYLVADKIDPGSLYDRILALNKIYLNEEKTANDFLINLRATDVMQRRVETLSSEMTLEEVLQAFSHSTHRGFPVLTAGKLVGIITQTDLVNASRNNLLPQTKLIEFMTPRPLTISPYNSLGDVLYHLNRYHLSRLPVTEGHHLVGIITRSDIIRIESEQFNNQIVSPWKPSYLVYQTQGPLKGNGRLLVPLINPETTPLLLELAAAIAQEYSYEIECLQVILISPQIPPSEADVITASSRRLLQKAERILRHWNLSVHTQIRVCSEVAPAILETINSRHIDKIVMGWEGEKTSPPRIFGSVVDTIIRQAPCEVILVKWGSPLARKQRFLGARQQEQNASPLAKRLSFLQPKHQGLKNNYVPLQRWLIPIRDWQKSATLQLLPALIKTSTKPDIFLCQVHPRNTSETHLENKHNELEEAAEFLEKRLRCPIQIRSNCSNSIAEAILDLAENHQSDVIVLGASREGLLTQVVKGNIPETIARQSSCTVILVRPPI